MGALRQVDRSSPGCQSRFRSRKDRLSVPRARRASCPGACAGWEARALPGSNRRSGARREPRSGYRRARKWKDHGAASVPAYSSEEYSGRPHFRDRVSRSRSTSVRIYIWLKGDVINLMRSILIGSLLAFSAWGQTTSSLTGSVLDAGGVAVEAATVRARNTQTGTTSTAVTARDGKYTLANLAPGAYDVSITGVPAMVNFERKNVTVDSKPATLDIRMDFNTQH